MVLKSYLQQVLADVGRYAALFGTGAYTPAEAFAAFWAQHPRTPFDVATGAPGQPLRPYQTTAALAAVPQLTVKVPTGGGKTYLACHAVGQLLGAAPVGTPRLVVWLAPSLAIVAQTLKALRNGRHPYRQALNAAFGGRVAVIDKDELAQGQGLLAAAQGEQLTVVVLCLDTLRTADPDNRKAYEANSNNLALVSAYAGRLPAPVPRPDGTPTDPTATMNVLRALAPLVIIDESHHAKTTLSDKLLAALAPRFVLELTATPRPASNLLALVSAQALKQEHMVKLPVVVQNRHRKADVLGGAKLWQERLEALATAAHKKQGAGYVRPIVLLQAEARTSATADTYDKVKADLLALGVPDAQIKIKTADRDELKDIDLLAPGCPVRYIITINALAEGWDCSFAYILASLANRSSPVQVEQLLGRVLRQPYATPHPEPLLNCSYVLTASTDFQGALANIVQGLQVAGFTAADCYRAPDAPEPTPAPATPGQQHGLAFDAPAEGELTAADYAAQATAAAALAGEPAAPPVGEKAAAGAPSPAEDPAAAGLVAPPATPPTPAVAAAAATLVAGQHTLEAEALAAFATVDAAAAAIAADPTLSPNLVAQQVPGYVMRAAVAAAAQALRLPNFMVPISSILPGSYAPLAKGSLLAGFDLSQQSTAIDFQQQAEALRVVDLAEQADHSYTPIVLKADAALREPLLAYFRSASPTRQRQDAARAIGKFFGKKLDYLPAAAVQAYVERVLAPFDPEQLRAAYADPAHYANLVYEHLNQLTNAHAMRVFDQQIDTNSLGVVPDYTLPARRVAGKVALPLARSLYEREEAGNGPEERLMQLLADADNVVFWTRNPARPGEGFRLNGPLANHYPDFIALTAKGNTLLLEPKGDVYDNTESAYKRHLGAAWALAAGKQYKYFMLFDKKTVDKAYRLDTFGPVLAAL